jgi:hypothetical protein
MKTVSTAGRMWSISLKVSGTSWADTLSTHLTSNTGITDCDMHVNQPNETSSAPTAALRAIFLPQFHLFLRWQSVSRDWSFGASFDRRGADASTLCGSTCVALPVPPADIHVSNLRKAVYFYQPLSKSFCHNFLPCLISTQVLYNLQELPIP